MNNTTVNTTQTMESLVQTLIEQTYEFYVIQFSLFSSLAFLLYATILGLGQEIEYIWLKKFSLPAVFYIFTRYGGLIFTTFTIVWDEFLSVGLGSDLVYVIYTTNILEFIGLRGLLIARAYALCKGNKILAGLLALSFFTGLACQVYKLIVFKGCTTLGTDATLLMGFISSVISVISGTLELGICWWNIWGTWRSKIKAGIQNGGDLVSIFLKQTISGLVFGVAISLISAVVQLVFSNSLTLSVLTVFENSIVVILISGFILDLRQRNSALIEASDISLPTLQVHSVLEHVHRSFLVEMGDHDENVNLEAGNNDFDVPTGLPDDAGQPGADRV